MSVTIELDDDLARKLAARCSARETLNAVTARLLTDQLELAGERRDALAVLLDEIGASARGELPPPDQETLREWLAFLCKAAGLRTEPD